MVKLESYQRVLKILHCYSDKVTLGLVWLMST